LTAAGDANIAGNVVVRATLSSFPKIQDLAARLAKLEAPVTSKP